MHVKEKPLQPAACRAWHDVLRQSARWTTLVEDAQKIMALRQPGLSFWVGTDDTPRCLMEQLVGSILRAHLEHLESELMGLGDLECSCGAEWWVQHRRADESIQLHFDVDEKLQADESRHMTPFLATVTYLNDGGAPTLVLPVAADTRGCWCYDDSTNAGAFLSYPLKHKHLAFDGRLLHGAPESLAVAGAAESRTTILVNVWLGHRVCDAERIPQELADMCTPPAAVVHGDDDFVLRSEAVAVQPTTRTACGEETASSTDTETGYPFSRPTLAAALRMRRLPVPGDGALSRDADFIYVPSDVLGLRIRAQEVDEHQERAAAGPAAPALCHDADASEVRQWAADSALGELD